VCVCVCVCVRVGWWVCVCVCEDTNTPHTHAHTCTCIYMFGTRARVHTHTHAHNNLISQQVQDRVFQTLRPLVSVALMVAYSFAYTPVRPLPPSHTRCISCVDWWYYSLKTIFGIKPLNLRECRLQSICVVPTK
jgi:hypothetical protein